MAFTRETLNKFGDWAGQKVFQYRTADTHTTAFANGYFNDAVKEANLETGDIIFAVTGFGGTIALRAYVATVNPATGVVTTTQMSTAA
jgi:hypothetical protein